MSTALLNSLKFVRGVVRKNKLSPELEHYQIKDGWVTGYNGHLALSAPVDIEFEAYPNAKMFSQAVEACADGESTALYMTKAQRLAVRSGGFKAFVPCLEEISFPLSPQGQRYETPDNFIEDIMQMMPFIAEDASRPWAMGMLVVDGMYMATNNVIFVQKWSGHTLPRFNFPRFAIQELIKIGVQPSYIQADSNSVSFHYDDGRWVRTQLYEDKWPFDKLASIMEVEHETVAIPEGFGAAVEKLAPFLDEKSSAVYFDEEGIGTSTQEEDGVHIAISGLPFGPIFSIHQLRILAQVATEIDWNLYPRPCIFYGDRIRGAAVGRNF